MKATRGRRAGCGRRAIAAAAERTKYKALRQRRRGARQGAGRGPRRRELRADRQPGRRRATRLHALRRLLRGLQRRRQEHGGAHLPARCGAPRRRDLHPRQGAPRRQGAARAAGGSTSSARMPTRTRRQPSWPQTWSCWRPARWGRPRSCCARASGASPLSDRLGAALLGQRRHHRLRLRRQAAGQRHRRRPSAPRSRASRSAPASRARSRSSTSRTSADSLTIQEGVLPSALAPILPALFIPNGRLLGALKSLIAGVYKGPFASLQTFFAVSHDSASGRLVLEDDRLALAWPGAKDEPVYRRLDAALEALVRQCRRQLRQEPARRHHDGPAARDGASAGRLRHGPRARRGRRRPQVPACSTRGPGAGARRRAQRALRHRRRHHAALARRQPAAHHHRAGRARHAAPGRATAASPSTMRRAAMRRPSRQWRRVGHDWATGGPCPPGGWRKTRHELAPPTCADRSAHDARGASTRDH